MKAAAATKPRRPQAERDALIEQYLPLVHHVLGRLHVAFASGCERDDLVSCGVVGLIHAAETYDETRGASFKTFAFTTIRGAILDELRRQDPMPRAVRERVRRLDAAFHRMRSSLGRPPTREELATELEVSLEDLDHDLVSMNCAHVLSLDEGGRDDDDDGFAAAIEEEGVSKPADAAERDELVARLGHSIGKLPEQERRAIVLYYHENLLLKEIGQLLGVSESRVSQILSRATTLLRMQLETDGGPR